MYYLSWLALTACLFGCGLAAHLALSGAVSRRTLLPLTVLLAPALLAVALGAAFALSAALKTPQEKMPVGSAGRPPSAEQPSRAQGERTDERTAPEVAPERTVEETTSGPVAPATIPEGTGPTTTFGGTASPTAAPSSPATSSPSAGAQAPR